MRIEELIIEASSLREGVSKWLIKLSNEEHVVLRDKLWRCLTEADFTPTVSGDSNGIFIRFGGRGFRIIFRASIVSTTPIVTITRVTEVSL